MSHSFTNRFTHAAQGLTQKVQSDKKEKDSHSWKQNNALFSFGVLLYESNQCNSWLYPIKSVLGFEVLQTYKREKADTRVALSPLCVFIISNADRHRISVNVQN